MSKKVIYISWVKLTDRYMRDYFLEHLIKNEIKVEVWDVVALTREQHSEVGELKIDFLSVLKSIRDLENLVKLKENIDATYVMLMTLHWKTKSIFQILSKYGCKVVGLSWGALPASSDNSLKRAVKKLRTDPVSFVRLGFDSFGIASYKKAGLIKPFDLVFTAGSVLSNYDQYSHKTIQLNLPDYEQYVLAKRISEPIVHGEYAVFLDLNMPYQSDLALDGLETVDPASYYQSLNQFFTLIEKQHNLKVVIAAHPKTDPNLDSFDGREVYRLITAELVKDCEFVISHHSTSFSYAVFNHKPCMFIYTNEMEDLYPNCRVRDIKNYASYLDASIYNIDKLQTSAVVTVKEPNQMRFTNFKYSFATSKETEHLSSNDIFLNEINRI